MRGGSAGHDIRTLYPIKKYLLTLYPLFPSGRFEDHTGSTNAAEFEATHHFNRQKYDQDQTSAGFWHPRQLLLI